MVFAIVLGCAVAMTAGARGGKVAPKDGAPSLASRTSSSLGWARKTFGSYVGKGLPADGIVLLVSVGKQTMTVLRAGTLIATVPVSTSSNGLGNKYGSCKTPLGLHRVGERIGDSQPLGRVFVGRVATDRVYPESKWRTDTKEDLVLTRILRLKGLEPGKNSGPGIDSFNRCIYIHGTNEEHLLGQPVSHGCVRVSNHRIVALYGLTKGRETWCDIVP
jgi:hypothetical protein